ncbi:MULTISPECIES: NAD(P)/FAD-dependent oxidoreductase [Pseudomonas]|uniref:NAD(P)/FAD-dependent oxidoreductase n=1 Tax=Pseudomonas TaxID=286 RepID=UPI0008635A09|nr:MULTISPECIES: FAD-dependent oxidoreductase [Pseudomonas]MDG9889991.1 FAD-binding oxidoreductase [Pseudomonas juntendi]QOH70655.1 FAD-binding oxidoreductase [Pseudomonas putida]RFQ03469.1 FAD-binding oxidoreductase [Pseudomonas putida]
MQTVEHTTSHVAVIGGGIVGLCTAFHLVETGFSVSIIEAGEPGAKCSSGNAGSLSSGSVAPLAMPGVLKQSVGMMFDSTGPLYIPASYLLQVAPWMARFVASASTERVAHIAKALHDLIGDAVEQHKALAAKVGCSDLIVDTGQIHLYPDEKALRKDDAGWALKRQHGLNPVRIGRTDILQFEPRISSHYQTGYHVDGQPWIKDPQLHATRIAKYLRRRGVSFVRDQVLDLSRISGGWQIRGKQETHVAQAVVVSAGAWSSELLKPLGVRVPLEAQRGYHLRFPGAEDMIQRVVVLADRKVFMTPMLGGLQAAGTVEFGGLDRLASSKRALLLAGHAKSALVDLDVSGPVQWMGHRPCLPDSMPVLGEIPAHPGLWCAFGHGHLGLTGAAGTGHLLAQAMSGSAQAKATLAAFSAVRF